MTLIELGEVTSGSELPPSADARADFDAWAVRRFALLVVAVLSVLTVTGSARPEPRMLRNLWSIPFSVEDRYTVSADSLYATTVVTGGRLTAYDLAGGAVRWTRPSLEPTGQLSATASGEVLLLPDGRVAQQFNSDDGGSYLTEYYRRTVAIDARTGAELWRRPGEFSTSTRDSALLIDHAADGADELQAFRLVRLADGAVLWSSPARGAIQLMTGGPDAANPSLLVTVTADGDARVLRLSDGTQVTAGHVDYRGGDPGDGTFVDMFADARTVYIRTADGRGESLTAYELGTLRKVWRVEGVARVAAYTCAQVVCSVQPDSVEAFDPGTGRMLWRAPARQGAWPFAPGWLATDDGTINAYTLIEAATGRRITGLGQGVPVLEAAGTTGYLVGSTRSPANRSSVSRIDLGTGRAALRGTIDRISDYGCSATADRLICATQNGRLVVADVG